MSALNIGLTFFVAAAVSLAVSLALMMAHPHPVAPTPAPAAMVLHLDPSVNDDNSALVVAQSHLADLTKEL